jgi:hypothetical protein
MMGMARTSTTAMTHYQYRASTYRLAQDHGDARRTRRRLAALRTTFPPPVSYSVIGDTVAAVVSD